MTGLRSATATASCSSRSATCACARRSTTRSTARRSADVLGAGYGEPIDQMAVRRRRRYDPALEDRYPYDPEKAKKTAGRGRLPGRLRRCRSLSINLVGQDTLAQALDRASSRRVGITLKPDITTDVGDYVTGARQRRHSRPSTLSWGRLPAVANYQLLWGPGRDRSEPVREPRTRSSTGSTPSCRRRRREEAGRDRRARCSSSLVDEAWFAPVAATPLGRPALDEIVAGVTDRGGRNGRHAGRVPPGGLEVGAPCRELDRPAPGALAAAAVRRHGIGVPARGADPRRRRPHDRRRRTATPEQYLRAAPSRSGSTAAAGALLGVAERRGAGRPRHVAVQPRAGHDAAQQPAGGDALARRAGSTLTAAVVGVGARRRRRAAQRAARPRRRRGGAGRPGDPRLPARADARRVVRGARSRCSRPPATCRSRRTRRVAAQPRAAGAHAGGPGASR